MCVDGGVTDLRSEVGGRCPQCPWHQVCPVPSHTLHTHHSHERGQWAQVNMGISCNHDDDVMLMVVMVVKDVKGVKD